MEWSTRASSAYVTTLVMSAITVCVFCPPCVARRVGTNKAMGGMGTKTQTHKHSTGIPTQAPHRRTRGHALSQGRMLCPHLQRMYAMMPVRHQCIHGQHGVVLGAVKVGMEEAGVGVRKYV